MEDKDLPPSFVSELYDKIDRFISQPEDADQSPDILQSVQNFAHLFDLNVADYESGSMRWIQLPEDESTCFLQSVDRNAKLIKSLSSSQFLENDNYAVAVNRMSGIQQRALSILEVEFKSILDDYQTSYDRDHSNKTEEPKPKQLSSSTSNVQDALQQETPDQNDSQNEKDEFLGYSDEMISHLSKLASGLIGGGHEAECNELYFFIRRNALDQNLKLFRFEKYSIDEMQKMQWEPIEKEVSSWIKMFRNFCTSLLPSERRLVDAVFINHKPIADTLFGNLTRIALFYFLSFAEAVMMTKRSAEKLFKFLGMYEAIRDSVPEVEKFVSEEWLAQIKSAASLINSMLGDSIFNIFIELEHSVKSDTAKSPVPGGAVHPLTRYTMNYLKYACEYSETLEQVFREHKRIDSDTSHSQDQSPFQWQLAKIMELLDANLEAKSKLYKDPGLSLIFMMNNGRYILQKTKGTGEMRTLMGDPWVRKRSSDLRSYHTNYKRETWTKLLQCLSHEGLSVNGKVMKPVLKERFKSFNAMFDEIHRTQTTWVVSDEQLQSELRVSISAIVIPAYRSFMGRFSQVFTPGRQTEKYIKYQPEDIETCIEELFDGSTAQQSKKR